MSYSKTIKKLNTDLLALIEKYHNSPLSDQMVDHLIRLCNTLNTNSNNSIQTLKTRLDLSDKRISNTVSEYKLNKEKNNDKFENNNKKVDNNFVEKTNSILKENDDLDKQIKQNNLDLELDNEYRKRSNEQVISIIKFNEAESIKRFDFQINNALESYNEIIQKYNFDLNTKLNKEKEIHGLSLVDFDKETVTYIAKIEKKIFEYNEEKNEFLDKLNAVLNNKKEKLLHESINQNKIINSLINDKNILIDAAKRKYQSSLQEDQQKRDLEQQNLKNESNTILRDFVYNITLLDEKETSLKQEITNLRKKETFNYFINLKKIHKNEEIKIIEINKIYNKDNLKSKNIIIKSIKKQALIDSKLEKKRYEKSVNDLNIKYFKLIEKIKHDKQLLELEKNTKIENINHKESALNKSYQEHSNIIEATLNSEIKIANIKYHQKATQAKYQYDLKRLNIEKDYDISEANFKKKLEMIESDIKQSEYEINSIKQLKTLLHDYEDTKYDKKCSYLNVKNLLEIELNKILNDYNKKQYSYNINATTLTAKHSIGLIELEDEKNNKLLELNKNRLELQQKYNEKLTNHKIYEQNILETYEKKLNNALLVYDNSLLTHKLISARFKEEFKIVTFNNFAISTILNNFKIFIKKFLPIVISCFKEDLTHTSSINNMINELITMCVAYFKMLVLDYNESINNMVYKHNEFEEKIKYKAGYEGIVHNYETENKRLLSKKNELNEAIANNNNTIMSYQDRIYSYQNQIYIENNKTKKNRKYIKALKSGLKDTRQRIIDLNKMNKMLIVDIYDIDLSILQNDKDYNQKIESQKKLQYESSITYYTLQKQINNYSTRIQNKNEFHPIILTSKRIDKYEEITLDVLNYFLNYIDRNNAVIYKKTDEFIFLTNESINRNLKLISNNHNENIILINEAKNKAINENNNQINETENEYKTKLSWINLEIENSENDHIQKVNDYKLNYEKQNDILIGEQQDELKKFYIEFNLMQKNKDEYKKSYEVLLKSIDISNINAKNSRNKRDSEFEYENRVALRDFLRAKDELIAHLPIGVKYKIFDYNKELKELDSKDSIDLNETKAKLAYDTKQIERKMHEVKINLDEQIILNNANLEKNIIKSKKNYLVRLKHINRYIDF